ncbi:Nonribosomal peptide synthetase imqB [Cladobotryum mycophilum]|uniref:Nonribosomal peptide synthetase imqB n=1 Tax=Cladobotryum mycophilum TaxID=491253 RepID=A0ABR0SVN1_9HYPO
MSSHRSFVSGIHHRRSILEVPTPRVFDFASYSFDVRTDIILSTLIIGGCICVPSDWERHNDIAGAINRLAVNSADLTPSVARLINPDSVPGLQVLKLGGKLSSVADVALWAPKTKPVNVYGPSECLLVTINVLLPNGNPRTIGRGHGAVTWVVDPDDHNRLVPPGTVGELVVEGPIVTKGYLHDPERTTSVFIESPDWLPADRRPGRSSERLYKTGDLVHYNPDGTLNFVGCKDTQVKVRGQRVGLSEVEYYIQQQLFSRTRIRINSIVELITPGGSQDSGGRPTLAGFLAMSQVEAVQPEDPQQLRQAMWNLTRNLNKALLKTRPQYMVPSVYAMVADAAAALPSSRSPPRTLAEQRIQRLWSRVLGLDLNDIAKEDHFFRSGGDSLNAIQLTAAATEDQLALAVEQIFANPVLAHMATVVRSLVENSKPMMIVEHANGAANYVDTTV